MQAVSDLEDQLECALLHTSLTECEEDIISHYTTISYVWGDPRHTRKISVNDGKDISVVQGWSPLSDRKFCRGNPNLIVDVNS